MTAKREKKAACSSIERVAAGAAPLRVWPPERGMAAPTNRCNRAAARGVAEMRRGNRGGRNEGG